MVSWDDGLGGAEALLLSCHVPLPRFPAGQPPCCSLLTSSVLLGRQPWERGPNAQSSLELEESVNTMENGPPGTTASENGVSPLCSQPFLALDSRYPPAASSGLSHRKVRQCLL